MFNIEGDVLNLSYDMTLDEVEELRDFLIGKLGYITSIGFEGAAREFSTSSLLQLLASIKKSRPEISIPVLECKETVFGKFGVISWRL